MEYGKQIYANKDFGNIGQNRNEAAKTGLIGKNLPEKRFTTGAISTTIWRNENVDKKGNRVEYRTVSIQKRYSGKDGVWRTSNSLRVNDLPRVALLLNKAFEYIVLKQNIYEPVGFSGIVKDQAIEEEIVI